MEQTQIMSRVEAVRRARGAGQSRTIGTDLLNSTLHHLFGGMKMPARERKSRYSHQPAFLFPEMDGAVLENPLEGNAVYVFDADWRELSKLSKTALFQHAKHRFQRIVHTGDWKNRLKSIVVGR